MDCVNNHSLLWCEERLTQDLQAVRERVAGRSDNTMGYTIRVILGRE